MRAGSVRGGGGPHPGFWRKAALAGVLPLLLPLGAAAQQAPAHIRGIGASATCAEWMEARRNGTNARLRDWALGYLSGVATGGVDVMHGLSLTDLQNRIDRNCRGNPTRPWRAALEQLISDRLMEGAPSVGDGAPAGRPAAPGDGTR